MQENGILKPIIFYQLIMTIQALKVTDRITIETVRQRTKKILAILYSENTYLTKLTEQVISVIILANNIAKANPANAPLLEKLREINIDLSQPNDNNNGSRSPIGPPPGPIC